MKEIVTRDGRKYVREVIGKVYLTKDRPWEFAKLTEVIEQK